MGEKLDAGRENIVERMNKRDLRDQKQCKKRSPPFFTKIEIGSVIKELLPRICLHAVSLYREASRGTFFSQVKTFTW